MFALQDLERSIGLLLTIAGMYACFLTLLIGSRLGRVKESLAYIK
jgi:hypothetical protein